MLTHCAAVMEAASYPGQGASALPAVHMCSQCILTGL